LASQFSFYSTIDRVWQFALGGCACLILRTKRSFNFHSNKIIGICIVLLVLTVLFAKVSFKQQTGSVLISALTLLAIVSKSFNFLPTFLKPQLEWVGDRSYSIYLVHMPLLYLTRYSPTPIFGTGRSQFVATVGAVGLSLVLGALSFSKIENRFRKSWITNVSLKRSLFRGGFAALVFPGCILLLIDIGSRNQYWGFENDLRTPLAAWELDAGCGHFGEISEPCLVSFNEDSETMLLIGDSHAIHLYPALFDAAKDRSLNTAIWTKGGCQVQFKQSEKKSLSDECLEQNLNILEWVKTNKPSLVVISQYVLAESSQSDLRNTLTVLQSITPNILLIENTPVFPDESRFMVRLPLLFPRYDPPKTFLQSKMHLRDNFASDELGDWARANQIDTVNLSSLFCSDDLCNRFSDAGWLYSDDDHLSLEGAKLATEQFEDYLRGMFQK
jgi:hypothetical protein